MTSSDAVLRALVPVAGPTWAGVHILTTTRLGGVSRPPYDTLNLGEHVGDAPFAVAANRARLRALLPGEPVWLRQVHGTAVFDADAGGAADAVAPRADAAVTARPGRTLAILTADCLPVVIVDTRARVLAVAHAGWRGLAAGVLEAAVTAVRARLPARAELRAWVGPAIGADAFEVGRDVVEAFGAAAAGAFQPRSGHPGKWWGDLAALAERRLAAAGVPDVAQAGLCTVGDPRFFSYRRDGMTGRFATIAWLADATPHVR